MYIQIYNGRIVRVSDEQMLEDDVQMDLPSDFDYENINTYEIVNGELAKCNIEILEDEELAKNQSNIPTQEERIAALEAALLELMGVNVDG